MPTSAEQLLGKGIYGIPEAARLSGVSTGKIRRWLKGYEFHSTGGLKQSAPVWTPQLPRVDGELALGFRDLLEVRFVDAFLREGVSWPTIRKAAERARELFGDTHPFSSGKFRTDGRRIFVELQIDIDEPTLIELMRRQSYFHSIISPYLKGIEFAKDEPVRWWPLGRQRVVVIDPRRCFGQPIVNDRGVPTAVLARAVRATGSTAEVAAWFEVNVKSVEASLRYEETLAA